MASFPGFYLTYLGRDLQAKAQAGANLVYTKMTVGDGALAEGQGFEELTGLINPILDLGIDSVVAPGDGTARLKAILSNQGVTTGFLIREIGIFADDPDTGEILYAYTNADTDTTADYLPAAGGATVTEINIEAVVSVGNATNISINISSDNFATKEDLANYTLLSDYNDHINDTSNPHKVTYAQTGAAAASHTHTASEVGAAAATHTHSANDITADTLSVARGGTGATTLTGIIKGNGTGAFTAATAGVDYAPGDFGLGTEATLATGDWNDYLTTGFYRGENLANAPSNGINHWYFVTASKHQDIYTSQVAIGFADAANKMWFRRQQAGVWEDWKEIVTRDQLISANITDATSANTANMIVKRDASGNFSAGTITAALSGNAATATKLATARTINGVSFDGTANISLTSLTNPASSAPTGGDLNLFATVNTWFTYDTGYGPLLNTPYGTLAQGTARVVRVSNVGSSADRMLQYFEEYYTGTVVWFRKYSNDYGWSAWKQIATTDSPAFTGTPTVPTAAVGTNTTQAASTAFVQAAITPANLGFTSWGNATAGGRKYPDGYIEQWMTVPSGSSATITWPIAFPNACFGAQISTTANNYNNNTGINTTTTGATLSYAPLPAFVVAYGN